MRVSEKQKSNVNWASLKTGSINTSILPSNLRSAPFNSKNTFFVFLFLLLLSTLRFLKLVTLMNLMLTVWVYIITSNRLTIVSCKVCVVIYRQSQARKSGHFDLSRPNSVIVSSHVLFLRLSLFFASLGHWCDLLYD